MFRAKLGLVRFFRVLFSDCVPVLLNDFYAQPSGSAKARGLSKSTSDRGEGCMLVCRLVPLPLQQDLASPDGSGMNKPRPRTKLWKTDIG